MVVDGDEPVGATEVSSLLHVLQMLVAGLMVEVVESLVAAAAASSAVEDEVADETGDEACMTLAKKDSISAKERSDVVVCASSDLELSDKVDEEEVVFCRAFCLLTGRGK